MPRLNDIKNNLMDCLMPIKSKERLSKQASSLITGFSFLNGEGNTDMLDLTKLRDSVVACLKLARTGKNGKAELKDSEIEELRAFVKESLPSKLPEIFPNGIDLNQPLQQTVIKELLSFLELDPTFAGKVLPDLHRMSRKVSLTDFANENMARNRECAKILNGLTVKRQPESTPPWFHCG